MYGVLPATTGPNLTASFTIDEGEPHPFARPPQPSATTPNTALFSSPAKLPTGNHTLTGTLTSNAPFIIQYFIVGAGTGTFGSEFSQSSASTPPEISPGVTGTSDRKTSPSARAITGSVIGAVVFALAIVFTGLLIARRRRRNSQMESYRQETQSVPFPATTSARSRLSQKPSGNYLSTRWVVLPQCHSLKCLEQLY